MGFSTAKKTAAALLVTALIALGIFKGAHYLGAPMEKPFQLSEGLPCEFKPGQVWSYKTRPGEEGSVLTVVKVDSTPKLGNIVSVYVEGVTVPNPVHPDKPNHDITHMPFTEKALKDSVTRLIRTDASLPGYEEGYEEWKSAFEAGQGGVFTESVSKAVGFLEKTLEDGKVTKE